MFVSFHLSFVFFPPQNLANGRGVPKKLGPHLGMLFLPARRRHIRIIPSNTLTTTTTTLVVVVKADVIVKVVLAVKIVVVVLVLVLFLLLFLLSQCLGHTRQHRKHVLITARIIFVVVVGAVIDVIVGVVIDVIVVAVVDVVAVDIDMVVVIVIVMDVAVVIDIVDMVTKVVVMAGDAALDIRVKIAATIIAVLIGVVFAAQ